MTLDVRTDRTLVRAGAHSVRYATIRFTAPDARRRTERLPLDVALVVDRSGSMAGGKLALAREAARRAVQLLDARDRVALVAYDSHVTLLAEAHPLDAGHCRALLHAIDQLEAGSSTALAQGWLTGCEAVARVLREESVARVLLLSDGLANVGEQDPEVLARHAAELRARGVATSTFGIGADFDERLMERMARAGGGNFYFIESARQIPDFLSSELGEALEVVARDVMVELELPEGVVAESLDDRRTEVRDGRLAIALDDLVARQEVELAVRFLFPHGREGERVAVGVRVTHRDGVLAEAPAALTWEYASHQANDRQPREVEVDRVVAARYAARAREEAAERNRAGDLDQAQRALRATARRIREYAGNDLELGALVDELEDESARHGTAWDAVSLKQARWRSYSAREAKDAMGRRRRQ